MRKRLVAGIALASALTLSSRAGAVNSVVIDSVSFDINKAACTVGVYITNDVDINGLVLALETRSSTGGAYMATGMTTGTFKWEPVPAGRVNQSPLGPAGANWPAASITNRKYPNPTTFVSPCTGRGVGNYKADSAAAVPDGISPDGFLHATVSQGDEGIGEDIVLVPGADPVGSPSLRFVFVANGSPGKFYIDTACITPANWTGFNDRNNNLLSPSFTRGVVTLIGSAVKELETGIVPQDYSLEQNYPNPFNAGTVIRFAQPVDGNVRIDVFNILGRKVKTLVNEFRSAGTHQTDWDGRSDDGIEVATGVYFYRITTDGFSSTRKMVLLK